MIASLLAVHSFCELYVPEPVTDMHNIFHIIKSRHPITAWLLLLILCIGTALTINDLSRIHVWNELIDQPAEISGTDSDLPNEVLFSKAYFLYQQGNHLQAIRTLNKIESSGKKTNPRVRYNIGSIYLQQATKLWLNQGVGEYIQINTLLDLAEQSLRKSLVAESENWQARFNLEYALRIRPPAKAVEESNWTGQKSSVHAILPGIPAGGP